MSEYLDVEKSFIEELAALGWAETDQVQECISADSKASLRRDFREWFLLETFSTSATPNFPKSGGSRRPYHRQMDDLYASACSEPVAFRWRY